MRKSLSVMAVFTTLVLLSLLAQGETYMTVGGTRPEFRGDVTIKGRETAIAVQSFSLGIQVAVASSPGSPRSISRPDYAPVSISKYVDATSPAFLQSMVKGEVLPTITLEVTTRDATKTTFYKITLTNVLVSSVNQSAGDERPEETITFSYEGIDVIYTTNGKETKMHGSIAGK